MIDQQTELKAGGKVRISGVWYPLRDIAGHISADIGNTHLIAIAIAPLIQEYDPPNPEPFQWIDLNDSKLSDAFRSVEARPVNEALTKEHGDPTIRTYANENAAEFGLLSGTDVLCWNDTEQRDRWEECEFRHLNEGDQWRLQPAAPKGVKA